MTDVGQDTSDETRRRLLKGALAASTVVTLGYGGAAAAASLGCIEKLGSLHLPDPQFVVSATPPDSIWVWREVAIRYYAGEGLSGPILGFRVYPEGDVYRVELLNSVIAPPVEQLNADIVEEPIGWVLVYFDSFGNEVGTYPEALESDGVPVTGSCLASINPGLLRTVFSG